VGGGAEELLKQLEFVGFRQFTGSWWSAVAGCARFLRPGFASVQFWRRTPACRRAGLPLARKAARRCAYLGYLGAGGSLSNYTDLFMAAPSNPLGDWGERSLGRRQATRMSRHFADVGVGIPAARLREIASGAPVGTDEWVDVVFGLVASELKRSERTAKFARSRRRGTHWLIFAVMVLVALNVLLCMACALLTFMQHASGI
jgi:hypothetical protein